MFTVHCQVTPQRAFEGDPITVEMTVKAETAVPPTELWHVLPREATCVAGNNRVVCTLRPGEMRTFQHSVVFAQRGNYTLGRLYGRVHPATDLQPWLFESPQDQVCSVYPRIVPLPRHLPPLHTYASFGHYVSPSAGEGLEFAGVRQYSSGDRLRRVHWRTSLARQQLYVNDYYCERNADVVILLDTLVSIGTERVNTLDVAVRAAASLAAHYLYYKDRVGLINYGGVCTWVPPAVGQLQLYRLLDALLETRTHFSYLTKDVTLIPPRVMPPGALIFVLTTLLEPRLETALHDLLARAFNWCWWSCRRCMLCRTCTSHARPTPLHACGAWRWICACSNSAVPACRSSSRILQTPYAASTQPWHLVHAGVKGSPNGC